jgi:hypothetical protein
VYHQLFNSISVRGKNTLSFSFNNDLKQAFKDFDSQICVDLIHSIDSSSEIKESDNIAACMADGDYSEIEIHTIVPKFSRLKKIKTNKKFQWDLLNIIRHELEHVIQGCNLIIQKPTLKEYDRSESNFLLSSCEVPAYVHGFRIGTNSRTHFLKTITSFISTHGLHLKLSTKEINYTIKIWNDYLKNLRYYNKI